jgi:predicted kinase
VRQCHGDLHLGNIVLIDGRPTLFDAVEFNDEIACIDVLYDLAFLLMDLWHRRLPGHANAVWISYLAQTSDLGGLPLVPLFLSCRAAVRAKTSATAASVQDAPVKRRQLETVAREYLEMAESFLHPPAARLIAVGGLSGSGKSVLARALAPGVGAAPGAVVLRSDEIRKRLCGLERLDRLGPDGYAPGITARVYATLTEQAALILGAGHSAVVDAVHAAPDERQAIEQVAVAAGVAFSGIWLDAPEAVLTDRVARRRRDPSDATIDVVRDQIARGTGVIAWRRIDASLPPEQVLHRAQAGIGS